MFFFCQPVAGQIYLFALKNTDQTDDFKIAALLAQGSPACANTIYLEIKEKSTSIRVRCPKLGAITFVPLISQRIIEPVNADYIVIDGYRSKAFLKRSIHGKGAGITRQTGGFPMKDIESPSYLGAHYFFSRALARTAIQGTRTAPRYKISIAARSHIN